MGETCEFRMNKREEDWLKCRSTKFYLHILEEELNVAWHILRNRGEESHG